MYGGLCLWEADCVVFYLSGQAWRLGGLEWRMYRGLWPWEADCVWYFTCLDVLGDLMAWRLGVTNVSRVVALGS